MSLWEKLTSYIYSRYRLWRYGVVDFENYEGIWGEDTPLISAIIDECLERGTAGDVDRLLSEGADVDAEGEHDSTAIMYAAMHGNTRIVDLLLEYGADVDKLPWNGQTALMLAAERGHAQIVDKLLGAGADPDLEDRWRRTALWFAEMKEQDEVVSILKNKGSSQNTDSTSSAINDGDMSAHLQEPGYGGLQGGHAAMFVFDYDRMGSAYGAEAFSAISKCLEATQGVCAFLDGDLEVAAGGPAGVPGILMEMRDNGWRITSHRGDSPLVLLATADRILGYAAAMWTDNSDSIQRLHDHLATALADSYLGYLDHPTSIDLPKFHEIFGPLSLPVRVTFANGEAQ